MDELDVPDRKTYSVVDVVVDGGLFRTFMGSDDAILAQICEDFDRVTLTTFTPDPVHITDGVKITNPKSLDQAMRVASRYVNECGYRKAYKERVSTNGISGTRS